MYARILVPIDGSGTAERGLDEAIALARRLGSTLRILHVADARVLGAAGFAYAPPEQVVDDWRIAGEQLVPAAVGRARAQGVKAEGTVRCDPGRQMHELILEEARAANTELIVMGTHGRDGLPRLLLGSDAEFVLRESPVPVLLVRGPAGPEQAAGAACPIGAARS